METVRVVYHHETGGWWAESPDVDGWSAAGDTYTEVVKLAKEGVPIALGQDAALEHLCPGSEVSSNAEAGAGHLHVKDEVR